MDISFCVLSEFENIYMGVDIHKNGFHNLKNTNVYVRLEVNMKKKQKIWVKLLQALAIIIVIIALFSTGFYFLASKSANSSEEKNELPGLFKYSWVPIADDKFADIAKKDSLAVVEVVTPESVVISDAVIYETPTTSTDNVVYRNYSMGRVTAMDLETAKTVSIKSTTGGADIAIPKDLIHGKATMQIAILGKLFLLSDSSMGLIIFVVLPFFIFLVLQIVVIMCRILTGRADEDDDEEEYYYDDEKYDTEANYAPEPQYEPPSAPRQAAIRQPVNTLRANDDIGQVSSNSGYLEQEPLEQLSLQFVNSAQANPPEIKSQTVSTVINGEYSATVPHTEVRQPIASPSFAFDRAPINRQMPNFDATPAYDNSNRMTVNPGLQSAVPEIGKTPYLHDGSYKEVSAQVDAFLKSLNYDELNIERDMMQQATVEFNLDDLRQQMVREELLKDYDRASQLPPAESADMLEKILIELKDNAVDFSFQNSGPEDVKIQRSDSGNVFSVRTPNYKANIKIEIDKGKN